MNQVLASLASVVLSLPLVWYVVLAAAMSAPSPPTSAPAPVAVAPPAAATTPAPPSSTLSLLPSLFVSSPLPSLTVKNPPLPTAPLSENGCIAKSLQLASDCKFAFDAIQESYDSRGGQSAGAQLKTLETALAVSRASRLVGDAASDRCTGSADAFYGSGCACEPAVVLGLRYVDVVPPVAKKELMEIAKRCPSVVAGQASSLKTATPTTMKTPSSAFPSPAAANSLAAGIALLQDFLDNRIVRAAGGNASR